MSTTPSRRRLLAGTGTAVVAGLSGCLSAARDVESTTTDTFDAADLEAVSVTGNAASVRVRGSDRETIELRSIKQVAGENDLDTIDVTAKRREGTLEIDIERDDVLIRLGPEPQVALELSVPADLALPRLESETGQIDVRDVSGPVNVESENAEIVVSDVDGDVTARATNARIELTGIAGTVTAESDNGRIEVEDVGGIGTLSTTNGAIEATVAALGSDAELSTTNGRIDVTLVRPLDATVVARTDNGSISYAGDGPEAVRGDGTFELVVGDGTHRVDVETTNGSIDVEVVDR